MSFILNKTGAGVWQASLSPAFNCCGTQISTVTLQITAASDGTATLMATAGSATWQKTGIPPNELYLFKDNPATTHTLTLVSSGSGDPCNYPQTITVQALPTTLSQVQTCACLTAAGNGCPPGSFPQAFPVPSVGQAVTCTNLCTGETVKIAPPPTQLPLTI